MGIEIERKFLVTGKFPESENSSLIKQGYIDHSLCSIKMIDNHIVIFDLKGTEIYRIYVDSDFKWILDSVTHKPDNTLTFENSEIARIRIRDVQGYFTIKGKASPKGTPEFEYPLSLGTANYLLNKFVKRYIVKVRYLTSVENKIWEIDKFIQPPNLILAEIELSKPNEKISIPDWVGEEVTGNPLYYNSELIKTVPQKDIPAT